MFFIYIFITIQYYIIIYLFAFTCIFVLEMFNSCSWMSGAPFNCTDRNYRFIDWNETQLISSVCIIREAAQILK